MAVAAILNFGKNVNNSRLDKDILHQIIWEDASGPRDDHLTKSQNRKLIRMTSSKMSSCLTHNVCVDLSDYIFEPNLAQNTNTTLSTRRNGQIHIN